jgi:hypothetical protein
MATDSKWLVLFPFYSPSPLESISLENEWPSCLSFAMSHHWDTWNLICSTLALPSCLFATRQERCLPSVRIRMCDAAPVLKRPLSHSSSPLFPSSHDLHRISPNSLTGAISAPLGRLHLASNSQFQHHVIRWSTQVNVVQAP